MSSGFDDLVASLECRYDQQSARIMAREILTAAGLKEQAKYSPDEVQMLADHLGRTGDNLGAVWATLGATPSGEEARAPKAEVKKAAPKAEVKKAAPKAEAKKAAPKAEAKKAAPKAEKGSTKKK